MQRLREHKNHNKGYLAPDSPSWKLSSLDLTFHYDVVFPVCFVYKFLIKIYKIKGNQADLHKKKHGKIAGHPISPPEWHMFRHIPQEMKLLLECLGPGVGMGMGGRGQSSAWGNQSEDRTFHSELYCSMILSCHMAPTNLWRFVVLEHSKYFSLSKTVAGFWSYATHACKWQATGRLINALLLNNTLSEFNWTGSVWRALNDRAHGKGAAFLLQQYTKEKRAAMFSQDRASGTGPGNSQ